MKKLSVESNKTFYHGFILNEQELRRFNDLFQEQLKKEIEGKIENTYSIVFENGVVAQTNDIEEILSLENSGSAKIIELQLTSEIKDKRLISIDFSNADSNNVRSDISIKYTISGLTRDWVFITSSLMDERIKKIKRFNLSLSSKSKKNKLFSTLFIPVTMLLVLTSTLFTTIGKSDRIIIDIRKEWEAGKLTDPIEALIKIQEGKNALDTFTPIKYMLMFFGGLILILIILFIYLSRLYPVYNFCWGDYLEVYKKKESARKTVNTVVIIGLIISVVGGLIANYIGK